MTRLDLYGWEDLDLPVARDMVQSALGVPMELHDSDYVGGEYYATPAGQSDEITIQANFRYDEGHFVEPDFPEYRTLLYVNESSRWELLEQVLATLPGLKGLRREVL